ncbi:MAG TPA: cupin domain-containing protein [Dermatophilaceae bacterium]|nr:cupin domain-containing protein [Dermatophilaceae bacterium]
MTDGTTRPAAAPSRVRRGLSRLVALPPEDFAERHWGRAPLLTPAGELAAPVGEIFSAAAVDELLSSRALRTPFLRLARDGRTLPESSYTLGGGVGATVGDQVSEDLVLRHFTDGATIVLQALHRTWPAVTDLAQDLAADLGHPVQVNSYTTPPQNQGFADHYDVHDVFVLQVEGEKRWRVRPPVHELPLRTEPWEQRRAEVAEAARRPALLETVLRPGDCLYLPRGFLHSATALGSVSTHLTFGVHAWTRHTVLDAVLQEVRGALAGDVRVRASLPVGADPLGAPALQGEVDLVRGLVGAALDRVGAADVGRRLAPRGRAAQRAEPLGPLAQAAAAATARDGAGMPGWRLRRHLATTWTETDAGPVLVTRVGRVPVSEDERAQVHAVIRGSEVALREVAPDLLHRLVLAGIVVPAS